MPWLTLLLSLRPGGSRPGAASLNDRPRKTRGCAMPNEQFAHLIAALASENEISAGGVRYQTLIRRSILSIIILLCFLSGGKIITNTGITLLPVKAAGQSRLNRDCARRLPTWPAATPSLQIRSGWRSLRVDECWRSFQLIDRRVHLRHPLLRRSVPRDVQRAGGNGNIFLTHAEKAADGDNVSIDAFA